MAKSIYEYKDYKAYVLDALEKNGRGGKSRLAQALRCHLAYVSQVLRGQAQFSLEQADQINQHFAHSEEESDFFLLLVSYARAGTESLRKRYEGKIRHVLRERTILENRLKVKKSLPVESQAMYYSAWYYSAVHLLISIPEFQTKEKIAQHLGLPMIQINKVLEFLVSNGLAVLSNGRYSTGQVVLHLSNDSPWIPRHHASWRMRAVQSIDRQASEALHYTSVVSMSAEDAPAVRQILIEAIERVRAVVRKSPEKAVYCYALDFFDI